MSGEHTDFAALILRRARRHAGVSQRELAARSGQPVGSIAGIESGARDPSVTRYAALLEACGWGLRVVDQTGQVVDAVIDEPDRDRGGRRYPAHVELRSTEGRGTWWGDSWGPYWGRPPRPSVTFDLRGR